MSRTSTIYACRECGTTSPRWVGRCAGCSQWNTLIEERAQKPSRATRSRLSPHSLANVDGCDVARVASGVAELDRVLGGGLAAGSSTLLFGEPGVGKSTLALMALAAISSRGGRTLLVAAEESPTQVAERARRLGPVPESLEVLATVDVAHAVAAVASGDFEVAVVDSVSAMRDESIPSVAGSVPQVRNAADQLCAAARASNCALILVGHVTKDGELSGPRTLEHLVDTVVRVDGDRHETLRVVSALKHRFGPTGEVGLLTMTPSGLRELADSTLGGDGPAVPGVVATIVHTGSRSFPVEVQALVAPGVGGARRVAHQLSTQRMAILLAVLEARCGVELAGRDVFAATAGGLPATEPAVDLALALAVAAAVEGFVVPRTLVVMGEVGLAGELRAVPAVTARLREASRRGATSAVVPASGAVEFVDGLTVQRVSTLLEALDVVRVGLMERVLW